MKINSRNKETSPINGLTVSFPPDISAMDLIDRALSKTRITGKASRVPNSFIAYRTAFCKELQKIEHPVITQPQLSLIAKDYWSRESENVRREYDRIAAEARNLYKQICIDQKLVKQPKKSQDDESSESPRLSTAEQYDLAHDPNSWQILPQTACFSHTDKESEPSSQEESSNKNNQFDKNFARFSFTGGLNTFPESNKPDENLVSQETIPDDNPVNETTAATPSFNFLPYLSAANFPVSSNSQSLEESSTKACDYCKKKSEVLEKRIKDLEEKLTALANTVCDM
ncbi:10049_t:CDS:1 [Ambispora gerdemannii]|uniref:10049_t:CDS:1 n=1 Tax=Ambispora gerdemannii TaxID=144530 RepID=A0A9N9B9L9_9GLOM|nr:10049_t:CDS:1 [Ambispora gerdemannii]